MFFLILQFLLLLTIGLFLGVHLVSHLLALLYRVMYPLFLPRGEFAPEVSIVKPVKGIDRGMKENLESFCRLDYSGSYELIFSAEPGDPALPLVRALPGREQVTPGEGDPSISIVQRPCPSGWMGRAANLRNGVLAARHETILFSDTDVRPDPALLERFLQPLADKRIGLVFGWPAYRGCETLGAALLSISMNPAILLLAPSALIGFRPTICRYAVGTTMAMRKRVLHECGGLEAFAGLATEDVPLAREVARRGYRLHLVREPVIVVNERVSFKGWLEHVERWLVMTRYHLPLVYAASFPFFLGMPAAALNLLLAAYLGGDPGAALLLLLAASVVRLLSLVVINAVMAKDASFLRYLFAVPFHDALIGWLWLWGWVRREVDWRGGKYRLRRQARAIRLT